MTDSLIYRSSKVKPELTRWVNDVAQWDFKTIAPAHFQAAPGTAAELKAAFEPTLATPGGVVPSRDQVGFIYLHQPTVAMLLATTFPTFCES